MTESQHPPPISPRVDVPCTPTNAPDSAVQNETLVAAQQERPETPLASPVNYFIDVDVPPVRNVDRPCTPTGAPSFAVQNETTLFSIAAQKERSETPVRSPVNSFIDFDTSPAPHVDLPCTPTRAPSFAVHNETHFAPIAVQQERPVTPLTSLTDHPIHGNPGNISPVSSLSSALTEIDGEIVRENSPIPSPSRITQTPHHIVNPTAPHVNYTVSAQTGLATVVPVARDLSPAGSRHIQTEWSNDQNRISYELQDLGRGFSKSVGDDIAQWHDLHPGNIPPWASTRGNKLPPSYKVFDRDGGEHEISEIKVSVQPRQPDPHTPRQRKFHYKILILHSENGPDELVTVINRRKSDREKRIALGVDSFKIVDTFLVAWMGPTEGFEPEPFAVVVESVDGRTIKFRPGWFDNAPRASPRKRPVSRSSKIEPPQNAVFGPELVGIAANFRRSASSCPSTPSKAQVHGFSPGSVDSNDFIKPSSESRNRTCNEYGGSYGYSPMLPPASAFSASAFSRGCAPPASDSSCRGVSPQSLAAPSDTDPFVEDALPSSRPARPDVDHRIQFARRLFGHDRPLQSHIRGLLDEWHFANGGRVPPYHLQISEQDLCTLITCSVFDRTGTQRELSVFSLFLSNEINCADQYLLKILDENTASYSVVVLHTETEGDKLVALGTSTLRKDGLRTQCLLAWDGARVRFENEICAIAVHWNVHHNEKSVFSPDMFDEDITLASSWVAAMNESHSAKEVTRTEGLTETGKQLENLGPATQSPDPEANIQVRHPGSPGRMSPPGIKRQKLTMSAEPGLRSPDSIFQSPSINPRLRAKFVCKNSDSVRVFSLAGCDLETIYRKAKEFYKDRDPTRELVLAWKIPGMKGERYIWEGCQDEYDVLYEDLQGLAIGEEIVHEIEIKLADLEVTSRVPDVDMAILDVDTCS